MAQTKIDTRMIEDFAADVAATSAVTDNTAFTTTPSSVITAGTDLTWSGNTLNFTGSSGGISWSDPIDSSMTVDTDGAYDLGTTSALLNAVYTDDLFVQDKIIANGDTDTTIDFTTDNTMTFTAGTNTIAEMKSVGDNWFLVNPTAGSVNFVVHGSGTNYILRTDSSSSNVYVKNLNLETELDAGANSIGFTQQSATGDGTTTVDWGNGNKFKFTFGALNETFTFTAPTNPGNFLLMLVQDGTGSRTATWPATVKWAGGTAPTLTTDASAVDVVSFYYDGTNYYGNASLDFS